MIINKTIKIKYNKYNKYNKYKIYNKYTKSYLMFFKKLYNLMNKIRLKIAYRTILIICLIPTIELTSCQINNILVSMRPIIRMACITIAHPIIPAPIISSPTQKYRTTNISNHLFIRNYRML
jgi:hypothetical protein